MALRTLIMIAALLCFFSGLAPEAAGDNPFFPQPITVPDATTIQQSHPVVVGNRQVVVAQVKIHGADGNNMRIYAGVFDRGTGQAVRSNILVSSHASFGNSYLATRPPLTKPGFETSGVVATSTGKVVVAWRWQGLGNDTRILYRMIDPNVADTITPMKEASRTSSRTTIWNPSASALANGEFRISWCQPSTSWGVQRRVGREFRSKRGEDQRCLFHREIRWVPLSGVRRTRDP